jgi:uncharacterized protein YceH (UPF0502 family)
MELTPQESRVLGVLIEKAMTTPDQYPLSLNAATNGANQKNNRDPVLSLTDDEVFEALEGLRGKSLVVRVDVPGNRVPKYRHNAGDFLRARPAELAILAELLLRGPQTLGELRGRASRMTPLESLDVVKGMLTALSERETPLAKEIPPLPGSRAERYVQLLSPNLHPVGSPATAYASAHASAATLAHAGESASPTASPAAQPTIDPMAADRIATLEKKLDALTAAVKKLADSLGAGEMFSDL